MSRFAVMTLTEKAVMRIKEILDANNNAVGIIVGIDKGGCAGFEYKVELAKETPVGMDVIEKDGARVFVEPQAVLYLLGTEMDFETTQFRTGFVFHNPNQTSACGCGESVEIRPVSSTQIDEARRMS